MYIKQTKSGKLRSFDITAEVNTGFASYTSAQIIPALLWLANIAWVTRVTVFIRPRAGSEFSTIDAAAGIQVLIVLVTLLLLILSTRLVPMLTNIARTSVFVLFVYYFLSAISSIWSPMPQFTLYRAIEFITMFIGVLIALSYIPNFYIAEKKILLISSIVIILSLYVNLKLTRFSFSVSAFHTNSYSASAAMLFCYCLGEYFSSEGKRKKTLRRYGLFGLATLALGTSSASIVAACCGILFTALLYRKIMLFLAGCWLLILAFILKFMLGADFSLVKELLFPGKTVHQITTMTGRTRMWQSLFQLVQQSPFIGYGFAVLSTGKRHVFSSNPHNSLFSILLGTGALGMVTFLAYGFRLLREFFRTALQKLPGSVGCASAIIAGLVNSMAMTLVFDKWEESSLVFACLMAFFVLFVFLPQQYKKNSSSL
jgi:O-antigen ligase